MVTARPRATMITAVTLSVVLFAAAMIGWFAQPAETRARYTALQAGTLAFFLLFMIGFMLAVGLCWVRADAEGITFRNGLRTHHLAWSEIASIRYRDGDPWAYANLVDGHPSGRERYQLLGIQQTDGRRAAELAARVRAMRPAGD